MVSIFTIKTNKQQTETKGHKGTLGGDGSVCPLDCGDGVMAVVQTFKLSKLYASDIRSSLCISDTSIKLLKKT